MLASIIGFEDIGLRLFDGFGSLDTIGDSTGFCVVS